MSETNEGRPIAVRRDSSRAGLSPWKVAAILGVAVVAIGAVSFVVLNAVGADHAKTVTTSSCTPVKAPQCQSPAKLHASAPRLSTLAEAVGG